MKILVISNMYPADSSKFNPLFGVFVQETHNHLKESAGVDFTAVYTSIFKRGALWSLKKNFSLAIKTLQATISEDYDIVHAHYTLPSGLLGLIPKYLKRKKLILTTHGTDINILPYKNKVTYALVRFTLKKSDKIIAVSRALKEKVIADFDVDEGKIVVIPCGVDIAKFKLMDKETSRKKLNLPSSKFIILHLATLNPVKRTDILVRAFNIVTENYKEVLLIIAGDGPCREKLIELTKELKLSENILFTGYIEREKVPLWMASADLFALSSESEGTPVTVLEALATGVPIVATDVGGLRDIIDSEKIGRLVKVGDPDSFAVAILDMVRSINTVDKSLIRAKSVQYSWETICQKIIKVYTEIIKPST